MRKIFILNFGSSSPSHLIGLGVPPEQIPKQRWQNKSATNSYIVPARHGFTLFGREKDYSKTRIVEKFFVYAKDAESCAKQSDPFPELKNWDKNSRIIVIAHGVPGMSYIYLDDSCAKESTGLGSWVSGYIKSGDDEKISILTLATIIAKSHATLFTKEQPLKIFMSVCFAAAPKIITQQCLYESTAGKLALALRNEQGIQNLSITASLFIISLFIEGPSKGKYIIEPYRRQSISRKEEFESFARSWNLPKAACDDARILKLVFISENNVMRVERKTFINELRGRMDVTTGFEIFKLDIINRIIIILEEVYQSYNPNSQLYQELIWKMIENISNAYGERMIYEALLFSTFKVYKFKSIFNERRVSASADITASVERYRELNYTFTQRCSDFLSAKTLEFISKYVNPKEARSPFGSLPYLTWPNSFDNKENIDLNFLVFRTKAILSEYRKSKIGNDVLNHMCEATVTGYWDPPREIALLIMCLFNRKHLESIFRTYKVPANVSVRLKLALYFQSH